MVVSAFEPFIRVVNVYEDSASARAGVLPGDLIAFVNDTDIRPLAYDEASDLLAEVSADGGTVGVLREGERQLLTLTLSPAEVVIPNVDWRIDGDIAYLKVTLLPAVILMILLTRPLPISVPRARRALCLICAIIAAAPFP